MPAPYNSQTTSDELVADYANIIKDKAVLITGVTTGSLGHLFVKSIAKENPAWLILAGRNAEKLSQTAKDITSINPDVSVRTLRIDLGSLQSVREAATTVNSWDDIPAIDVLVNNAAIAATEFKLSPEGLELQLAVNYLGPFLFTNLVMKKVAAAQEPRVVLLSSDGHRLSPFRFGDYNFDGGKMYNRWIAYGQSKTAVMLFAISLAQKLGVNHRLQAYSVHPGASVWTNLLGHLDPNEWAPEYRNMHIQVGNGWEEVELKTAETAAATHVYAAFDPNLKANNGSYLLDCHVADPFVDPVKPWATSNVEAEKLWRLSEKLVGQEFSY